jgi:hypothetical protein
VQYRADADGFADAALDAAPYSNWRAPKLAEFQDAYAKGLFSQGEFGFNLDASPAAGYQRHNFVHHWTSDPVSKNKKNATVFNPGDGGWGQVGVNSAIHAMVVRTHTP